MILDFYLISIFFLSLGFLVAFIWATRRAYFLDPGNDNWLFVYAAAQSHRWRWFSDIRKFGNHFKTATKTVTIILLSVFQKLFRDKTGDRPYIALGGAVISVSTVLIYLIGNNYWGSPVGFFVAVLFLSSFWLWQIALYGGHINVATMMFLLSVFFVQQTGASTTPRIWLAVSGAVLFTALYSSSSAPKYMILFFSAVFYEKYHNLFEQNLMKEVGLQIASNHTLFFNIIIPLIFLAIFFVLKKNYKKITTAIYFKKSFSFLNKTMSGRNQFSLEHYINHADRKLNYYALWGLRYMLSIIILINILGGEYMFFIAVGFISAVLVLMSPNIKQSVSDYFSFILGSLPKSHFRLYKDFFAKRGIKIHTYTRGGGIRWVPKILFRIIPGHMLIGIVLFVGVFTLKLILTNGFNTTAFALITFASLSPILWIEVTRGVQLSRSYSPGFVGILLFIGYALSIVFSEVASPKIFWIIFALSTIPILTWNLRIFISDIYPSRMAASNLAYAIKKRGIRKIYTYDTRYNDTMVKAFPPDILKSLNIEYIKTLNDVKDKDGWVVIPNTSSKSVDMSSIIEGIEGGDYAKDPLLNELIETKKIEKVAEEKFRTVGTSKIWVHEEEVSSYLDLTLYDIKDEDRYRGYAWLIHSSKLKMEN